MQYSLKRVLFSAMPIVRNYSRYKANTVIYPNLSAFFKDNLHEGIQVLPFGDSVLELLVQDRNSTTTLVLFHAAVDPKKTSLPVFIGHQLTEALNANLVFVSEPALDLGASIGWYAGSPSEDLQVQLVQVLSHIQGKLKKAKHLMFYGSSAGGFASLYYSHQFQDSLAIVANPQTDIAEFYPEHVESFLKRVWSEDDITKVSAQTEVNSLYKENFPNYVGYLQNANDDLHIEKHCKPWSEATKDNPEKRRFLIDDWGEGHAPPNFFLLQGILQFAASVEGDWEEFLNDDSFTTVPNFEK